MRLCAHFLLLLGACGARTGLSVEADDGCRPTAEVCNRTDDDCDGSVDEGLPLSALSDPIVVRSPGETTIGECGGCDRAGHAEVIELDGGLLVLWQMQGLPARPQPNTFARPLDEEGNLLEPAQLWTERHTTQSLEAVVLPDGRRALTFCERADDDADYPSLQRIDDAGDTQGEPVRLSERRCLRDGVRAGSSGARFFSTVVDRGDYGFLALADPDLRSVSEVGLGPVTHLDVATSPSSVLVLRRIPVPPHLGATDYWSAQVFDETGSPRSDPPGFEPHSTHWEAVTARADGWWRIQAGEDGLRAATLSPVGAPLGEPRRFGADAIARWTTALALSDEGLVVMAELGGSDTGSSRSDLYLLDRDGGVVSTWRSDELREPPWRSARLRHIDGRVAIVYLTDAPDEDHNEVRLRLLACRP